MHVADRKVEGVCLTGMLQDNLKFGDAAQVTGGYVAGYLVASCLMGLVYLGLWLRFIVAVSRRDWQLQEPRSAAEAEAQDRLPPLPKNLIKPLGPWLWPAALVST